MKQLIKHLIENNLEEIVSKSLMNCHCVGLHSVMLLDCPGKTIRLYVSMPDSEISKPRTAIFSVTPDNTPLAFHPHHCDLTLHCLVGCLNNVNVKENMFSGDYVTKYLYHSKIKEGEIKFEVKGSSRLKLYAHRQLSSGDTLYLKASDIHSVFCTPYSLTAWLVYEGQEDPNYVPYCWSNRDLNKQDYTNLYRKATKDEVMLLLRAAELIN